MLSIAALVAGVLLALVAAFHAGTVVEKRSSTPPRCVYVPGADFWACRERP